MANTVTVEIIEENNEILLTEETVELILSDTGPQGPRGNSVLSGSGEPGAYLGIDGDFYINTDNNDMYGPKTAGVWGDPVDLVTPAELGYVHTQSVPATIWTITHGLGFIPNITVVNSFGEVVEGSYTYTSDTTVELTFDGAFSGKAYFS